MAVRKLKGSWWVDFQINFTRYRKRSPENTRMGAEAFEALLRQKLARGEDIDAKSQANEKIDFKTFSDEWIATVVKTENKPSEIRTKVSILKNHLLPFFGAVLLKKIDAQLIEQYKAFKTKDGQSNKSINNHLIILKRCLRVAQEWGRLESVPKVKMLKTVSQRLDFLTLSESKRLIQGYDEPMWREMLLMALRTGMRLGELCGLGWQDIDFKRRQLTISRSIVRGIVGTPKNNKIRHIPLTDEVCRAIYERRESRGLVFHRGDEAPLSDRMASNAIRRACKRAGVRLTRLAYSSSYLRLPARQRRRAAQCGATASWPFLDHHDYALRASCAICNQRCRGAIEDGGRTRNGHGMSTWRQP